MSTFAELRGALSRLSLHESTFSAGDTVVNRIAAVKKLVDEMDTAEEPWLSEWLNAEHYKAAVLYTAAVVNWKHEHQGNGNVATRQMRTEIIARFNDWVTLVQRRIDIYEVSSRERAVVAEWQRDLERFREDPVYNV